MARLPHPGGDNGNWGDILNDYLSQAHKSNGILKSNSVTSDTIAPNSVTNAAIATGAVNATSIANGSVSEALLDSGVQTKLNTAGDWDTLSNRPAVIAAGANAAEARSAIGAVDAVAAKSGDLWWDTVFASPSFDDTPAVTVATSGAVSGGTSITPTTDYYGDSHFRYDGCLSVTTAAAGFVSAVQPSGGATYSLIPEFITSPGCDKVDVVFKMNSGGTTMGIRITVNGRWLTLPLQWFSTTANTIHYIRLTFPSAKARSIRVEATNTGSFGGVVVPAGETVTRPAREIQKRMVILGDSYTKGANSNTTSDPATNGTSLFETFPNYVAKLLGCDSIINLGVGGTGWVDDNGGADSAYGGRVTDILAASPHILLAAGSRNDNAYTTTQIYNAAVAAMRQFMDIPVVEICGPEDDGSSSGTSSADQNESVKQAARTAGHHFNDMIGVITSSDKNAADGVHPSVLGAQKLAKAFYASLDRTSIDTVIAAAVGGRASIDLALSASPSSAANAGATVTLTATQSTQRTGSVSFYANGTLLGTSVVSSGVASFATSSLSANTYTFTARFTPANPMVAKSVTSPAISGYIVSANLGFTDSFTRSDGAVGSTENGKSYTTSGSGAWVVSSNKLANPTLSANSFCLVDAGTSTGTLQVTIGGTGSSGLGVRILFRALGNTNNLQLLTSSGKIALNKVVSNVTTQVALSTDPTWVAGDVIAIVMSGDTVTVKKNGTNVAGLVGITVSDFNTATLHGVGTTSSGAGATFDNLSFVAS